MINFDDLREQRNEEKYERLEKKLEKLEKFDDEDEFLVEDEFDFAQRLDDYDNVEYDYELFPGIFANDEQKVVLDEVRNFIKTGKGNDLLLLNAKAGAGKSSVVAKALREVRDKNVIVGALTHKAKEVIENFIGVDHFSYMSIASMLGMLLNYETGKFEVDYNNKYYEPPISEADLIVIDEASMVNEEALDLIFSMKSPSALVIMLGDSGQLPCIREKNDPNYGKISPVFTKRTKELNLTIRVRQGENSTVLPYADYYHQNSHAEKPVLNPIPSSLKKDSDDLKFIKPIQIIDVSKELLQQTIKERNPNLIRLVCYRNSTRSELNKTIRDTLFNNPNLYEKDDLMVLFDSHKTKSFETQEDVKLENSQEFFVDSVDRAFYVVEGQQFSVYELTTKVKYKRAFHTVKVIVLDPRETERYGKLVAQLFKIAKDIPKSQGKDRAKAFFKAYSIKNRFANVDYGYAMTSHKSQGSTFQEVIVHERDIMSIGPITNSDKSKSMYTAITRCKDKCYIVI